MADASTFSGVAVAFVVGGDDHATASTIAAHAAAAESGDES